MIALMRNPLSAFFKSSETMRMYVNAMETNPAIMQNIRLLMLTRILIFLKLLFVYGLS